MSSPQEPNQPGRRKAAPTPPSVPPPYPGTGPGPDPASGPSPEPSAGYQTGYAPPPYGQNAPPPPFGLPEMRPQPKSRKGLYIVLGIVAAGLVLVAVGVVVLLNLAGGPTNQAEGLAEDFTGLVIAGESDKAYDFLDPALQEQLSHEDFVAGISSLNMDQSCTAAYHHVSAETQNGTKAAAIEGLISCDNTTVELEYRFEGTEGSDDMKMINIKLLPPQ